MIICPYDDQCYDYIKFFRIYPVGANNYSPDFHPDYSPVFHPDYSPDFSVCILPCVSR